jgi:hypothetical protein
LEEVAKYFPSKYTYSKMFQQICLPAVAASALATWIGTQEFSTSGAVWILTTSAEDQGANFGWKHRPGEFKDDINLTTSGGSIEAKNCSAKSSSLLQEVL